MKLGYAEIEKFLQKPDRARAILLYGPNVSLAEQRRTNLFKYFLPQGDDGFNTVAITPDQVKQTPSLIADELSTLSFFGGRKVIVFKDADDKHVAALTDALSLPETEHRLIILGGELSPRSALRSWAEGHADVAAIPCYEYEARDMVRLLQQYATEIGARLDRDAQDMLVALLGTQADFIPVTLAKLATYAGTDKPMITGEMVRACCVDQTEATTDDIIHDVMGGQLAPLQRHIAHYYAAGESSVALLRAVQYYLYRIKTVHASMKEGASTDEALNQLKPPVFFKEKQKFLGHVHRWSTETVDRWLPVLLRTEAQCKTTGAPDELLVRQLLLQMAS